MERETATGDVFIFTLDRYVNICYTFSWGNKEKFTQRHINYELYNNTPYRSYISRIIFYEGHRILQTNTQNALFYGGYLLPALQ